MSVQSEVSSYWENQLKRFTKHLDPKLDVASLVLKGHLFAEELLLEIINLHCKDPTYLNGAKLSFSQKLKLASAMYSFHLPVNLSNKKMWTALDHLNKLRNTLAHTLDSPDANKKIIIFLNSVRDVTPPPDGDVHIDISDYDDKLLSLKIFKSLNGILGYLSCVRGIAFMNTPEKLYSRSNIDKSDFTIMIPERLS